VTDVFEEGTVLIHGEYWSAVRDVPVAKGKKIRVSGWSIWKLK